MIESVLCKKCLEEKGNLEKELEEAKTKLSANNSVINNLKDLIKELEKDRAAEISALNVKVDSLENKLVEVESQLIKAQDAAKQDPLTKLFNRGTLDAELKKLDEVFERYDDNFAVAFIDLDFFKKINDTFGHAAGDMVLQEVSKILKENSRKVDLVARYGGEEIVIVLPKKDIKQAVSFAEKIRGKIQNHPFTFNGTDISVTASIGVASRRKNSSLKETLASADKSVYDAKENGRNQVKTNDIALDANLTAEVNQTQKKMS
jgi:diguanylate cyclase (GGDEF)-like protein